MGVLKPSDCGVLMGLFRAVLGADERGSEGPKRRRFSSGVKRSDG